MGIADIIGRHARKPTGWVGRLVVWGMTRQTRPAFAWTADLMDLAPTSRVVEVGFGRGETLAMFADRCPEGHVAGVEISQTMLDVAGRDHAQAIAAGRMSLHLGDGHTLPLEGGTWDRAVTINTIYITEKPSELFAELFRVLAPGGLATVCFPDREVFSNHPSSKTEGFFGHELSALEEAFRDAGFADVAIHRADDLPLPARCLVGRKPAPA